MQTEFLKDCCVIAAIKGDWRNIPKEYQTKENGLRCWNEKKNLIYLAADNGFLHKMPKEMFSLEGLAARSAGVWQGCCAIDEVLAITSGPGAGTRIDEINCIPLELLSQILDLEVPERSSNHLQNITECGMLGKIDSSLLTAERLTKGNPSPLELLVTKQKAKLDWNKIILKSSNFR